MKVIVTNMAFYKGSRIYPGTARDPKVILIPDKPTRKVSEADDAETKALAVKGEIPAAYAPSWMKPWAPVPDDVAEVPDEEDLKPTGDRAVI